MNLSYALRLPVDLRYVTLVRHLCVGALVELGVVPECIDDIALALTEATANVVQHSGGDDGFEVRIAVEGLERDAVCRIEVIDTGTSAAGARVAAAFAGAASDVDALPGESAEDVLTHGRGLALMRILVDRMAFSPAPGGTTVVLVKHLELAAGSVLAEPVG